MEAKRARVEPAAGAAEEQLKATLMEPALHYLMMHGLVYADKQQGGDASRATQCPVALLPGKLPAAAFHEVVALAPLWNKLVDAVSRDLEWLYQTLEHAGKGDPFTGRLVEMSRKVHSEGLRQRICLGIHRSDYMLHEPDSSCTPRFLQVELNTIASSMGAHAGNTTDFHKFLLGRYGRGSDATAEALRAHFGKAGSGDDWVGDALPENPTLRCIPAALAKAHQAYGAKGASVLFLVQGGERNYADQRWIEHVLWQEHQVPVVRKTLKEVCAEGSLDAASGRLCLGGSVEISVAYLRAGYTPDDYPSEEEWSGRLLLERSLAIKCPNVDYQLVGAKKVQQALAKPGAVERFLNAAESAQLRRSFAGLWGLGPGEGDAEIIQKVHADPRLYVLKPQREGGGNNFYADQVSVKLKELSEEARGAYILMQRIVPKPQASILTREGSAEVADCVSEYGFYSVFVGDGTRELLSEHAGHLVRTKKEGVDEGGVAAGYAVISSPFLVT